MCQRNSCAYDLGAEDEERFSTGYVISNVLEQTIQNLRRVHRRQGPCCFVTYQGTC